MLSRDRYDLRAHMGPETSRQQEAMIERHEAWHRFLGEDDVAADALNKLREISEDLDAPYGLVTPICDGHSEEEVESFTGPMNPHAIFSDAREREGEWGASPGPCSTTQTPARPSRSSPTGATLSRRDGKGGPERARP